ncbi:hypothetical protein FBY41_2986 [Humibacillus xanthopallidus]|uniref:Uncharacterized protein n=1 Tax=Humibacillus xanthopallidus TaxID=412689 RepID=A0A543HX90_9MICO|nr:hypothetical protein FBY41_2986 [Humibacillus xanthopallidus]
MLDISTSEAVAGLSVTTTTYDTTYGGRDQCPLGY